MVIFAILFCQNILEFVSRVRHKGAGGSEEGGGGR